MYTHTYRARAELFHFAVTAPLSHGVHVLPMHTCISLTRYFTSSYRPDANAIHTPVSPSVFYILHVLLHNRVTQWGHIMVKGGSITRNCSLQSKSRLVIRNFC
jgi:hypothetical protein